MAEVYGPPLNARGRQMFDRALAHAKAVIATPAAPASGTLPHCDMSKDCDAPITHLDTAGYVVLLRGTGWNGGRTSPAAGCARTRSTGCGAGCR